MAARRAVWGWQRFFEQVMDFLRNIESSQEQLEHCMKRLQLVFSGVHRIRDILSNGSSNTDEEGRAALQYYESMLDELLECLREVYGNIESQFDQVVSSPDYSYHSSIVNSGGRGRPKFDITLDQLEYLRSLSFSWKEIASMLGVSRMTIYRRRLEYGMLQDGRSIEDDELLVLLREMRSEFPDMGEVMVRGRLRALGYKVTRHKLRSAIRETDPINTTLRAYTGPVFRRTYNVPGPNSLWHIGKCLSKAHAPSGKNTY